MSGVVTVGVVTVSFGSEAVLEGFLASLPSASSHELVTVVADNKASAGAPAAALAQRFGALYLPLPENRGYGGAMNAAIGELPDDIRWILISNPDIEIRAGAIDELVRVGEADARVAAVGPLVITDGEVYPSARALPSLGNGIGHALLARVWRTNPFTASYRNDTELPPRERDAGWLSGSCLLVRREAFDAVGGFDDDYFMYFEDVDLGARLGAAGWLNRYAPSAVVEHSGAHSTDGDSSRMVIVHHQSAYRFLSRRYSGWYNSPVRLVVRAGLAGRAFLMTRILKR